MQAEIVTATAEVKRRGRLGCVLGGCGALALCAVLAAGASAIYWTVVWPVGGIGTMLGEVTPMPIAELPAGAAAAGEQTFGSAGCVACHSLEPDTRIVGPSLAGVGALAATRKPDLTAEAYLLESIITPNAYVAPGFPRNVMPGTYQSQLSAQELADLVAFLLTQ